MAVPSLNSSVRSRRLRIQSAPAASLESGQVNSSRAPVSAGSASGPLAVVLAGRGAWSCYLSLVRRPDSPLLGGSLRAIALEPDRLV